MCLSVYATQHNTSHWLRFDSQIRFESRSLLCCCCCCCYCCCFVFFTHRMIFVCCFVVLTNMIWFLVCFFLLFYHENGIFHLRLKNTPNIAQRTIAQTFQWFSLFSYAQEYLKRVFTEINLHLHRVCSEQMNWKTEFIPCISSVFAMFGWIYAIFTDLTIRRKTQMNRSCRRTSTNV